MGTWVLELVAFYHVCLEKSRPSPNKGREITKFTYKNRLECYARSSLHLSGSFSTAYVVPSTAMIILISLSYISIHVIYHELTMTCSPVGLISSMGRALSVGRSVA